MQTLKTAVVVVLLLVVLYGAYDILTRPAPEPPPEIASALEDSDTLAPPEIGFEGPVVVNPDQSENSTSPAPPLGDSGSTGEAPAGGSTNTSASDKTAAATTSPGIPVEPQPPVSRFVPPAAPPTPPDPRLQQNPFLHDKPAPTDAAPDKDQASGHEHGSGQPSHDTAAHDENSSDHDHATVSHETPSGTSAGATPNAENVDSATVSPAGAEAPVRAGERAYQRVRLAAERDVAEGRYRQALAKLSIFYRSPDLSPTEQAELLDWLDPLAARVIYSRESLLEDPYVVRKNDTLYKVAEAYQVPWQLLQKINGIANPEILVPGTTLKVVRGPFRAEVDLSRSEITVFLGELYAGRFPVTIGQDPSPKPGEYQVRDKQTQRAYYGANNRTIPAGSPLNPYGNVWIDLGNDICIHGSPARDVPAAGTGPSGCIGLSPKDAEDLFAILSVGSTVKIRP